MNNSIRVGFALTGSFCTFERIFEVMKQLVDQGYDITPILSENAGSIDTRFGKAEDVRKTLETICKKPILDSITTCEPIGPKSMFDVLVVAPCTGNTISKLAHAITDTAVTMAVKSHLRCNRPVVLGISTNDALSGSASNIGTLLNRRHYYFVPFGQDNPTSKPCSLVAHMEKIADTIDMALDGEQIQPIIV